MYMWNCCECVNVLMLWNPFTKILFIIYLAPNICPAYNFVQFSIERIHWFLHGFFAQLITVSSHQRPLPRPWVFASMISLMRPAPTLFFAASLTLYQVPQRRFSSLKERSLELMNTSFHSSVLSTEYWSTKPARRRWRTQTLEEPHTAETLALDSPLVYHRSPPEGSITLHCFATQPRSAPDWTTVVSAAISYRQCAKTESVLTKPLWKWGCAMWRQFYIISCSGEPTASSSETLTVLHLRLSVCLAACRSIYCYVKH